MNRVALVVAAGLALAACSGSSAVDDSSVEPEPAEPSSADPPTSSVPDGPVELEEVGEELIEMARVDQEERSSFGEPDAAPWNDEERTARLIEIVDEYGWPAPDVFGVDAASAAWLIAQHSDADPAFQQRALVLLTETGDYPSKGGHVALLTDRVATNTGQPQVYGSQVGCSGDRPIPDPDLAQPDRVGELRTDVGLEPLADYLARFDQHCRDQAQIPADAGCRTITGATLLLGPRPVILVGEVHGTNESPAFVEALACTTLSYGLTVTVGLEIPEQESDSVDAFLASDGGPRARRRLLERAFWASDAPDGRRSTAMLELLDGLRRHITRGADLHVVLLDTTAGVDRDAVMATRVLDAIDASPDGVVIALTGNVHTRVTRGSSVDPDHEPMGHLIERSNGNRTVTAIDVRHDGGAAWVCPEDGACGRASLAANATGDERLGEAIATVDTLAQPNADGFHGTYFVGELSPAEPAADVEPDEPNPSPASSP